MVAKVTIEGVGTFIGIDSEEYRTYTFPGGDMVTIQTPAWLAVSERGGHRIIDTAGHSHYIPTGWLHLEWKAKDGAPRFVA